MHHTFFLQSIKKEYLRAWIDQLASVPRSAQMLVSGSTKHPLISSMEQAMMRYLKDVKYSIFRPDKRCVVSLMYSCTFHCYDNYLKFASFQTEDVVIRIEISF